MPLRKKITKSEIVESKMLTMAETLEVLHEIGFVNISENMIRKYLTLGLLERPRMGPPSFFRATAKYESYFSKQQLLAIVDIRLRMGRGYKIKEILRQQREMFKRTRYRRNYRLDIEKLVDEGELYLEECIDKLRTKNIAGRKSIEKLLKLQKMKRRNEKRLGQEELGGKINPEIVEKIDAVLDRKFSEDLLTV